MFSLISKKVNKRIGKLATKNGVIETPFFMPDATYGFVRSLAKKDLETIGVGPMVVNTYHLYLRPGMEIIKKSKGINNFMNWPYPLLSDSGGYQVFSLIHKNPKMGKITDNEVIFKSVLDGSIQKLTPEKSIQIQFGLGVDMMVCLDDPPPNYYSKDKIKKAVERTIAWAKRCMIEYKKQIRIRKIKEENRPLIFCVIQGGKYLDLREMCTNELIKIGFSAKGGPALGWDGYGFGARHIDQEGNIMEDVLAETAGFIPEDSLRFALGVGTPEDIVKCTNLGWDMFDCVIPTREGRHGRIYKFKVSAQGGSAYGGQNAKLKVTDGKFYEIININNEKFKNDFSPVDSDCDCELCRNYSRAYLNHLFALKEPLGMRLASLHNLRFYMDLMHILRQK